MFSRIGKTLRNVFRSNPKDVPKSQRVSDTGAEEPSTRTGRLRRFGRILTTMCGSRVRDCSGRTLVTAPPCPQQLVLQLAAAEQVASGPVIQEILPQEKNDSSCSNLKATAAEKEGRRTLEKRAQEEEEEYARQQNIRMRLQERLQETLHEESLEEAERFAVQQKQRFIDNERCRIREEEAQEKAQKYLLKRKLRNVLLWEMALVQRTECQKEVKRQTEQRLKEMERWKTLQKEALEEAKREMEKRKLRNVLLHEKAKIKKQQILKEKLKKAEEEKQMQGSEQEEQKQETINKEEHLAIEGINVRMEIVPAEEALMLPSPGNIPVDVSAEELKDSLPEAEEDVSEKPEAANTDRAEIRKKELERRERKNAALIRKAPLKKKATFYDIPDSVKRRTRFYQIVEEVDGTLDPSGLDRRLVEKALPTIDDFQLQSFLGEGSYGKVYKAQHRQSGKILAIKTIELHNINERHVFKWVTVEQRILRLADEEQCPFIVGLRGSFRTPNHMCLAMEYAEEGDLNSYVTAGGISLERVRFYSACMVLGLQFLHRHNIAHRDIKAANILLYGDGYAKITDFGLCKEGMTFDRTATNCCGTLYYMAPEIFSRDYTRSVDWWALGVTIFKLLTGTVPFYAETEIELLRLLKRTEPKYPDEITEETRSLLVNLLKKDPAQRLGAGEHGAEDVKKSPFFQGLDWEALEKKELEPPFIPGRRTHGQPEESLKLKAKVEAKVCEEADWALVELDYPLSSASETEM